MLSEFGKILIFIMGGLLFVIVSMIISKLLRPDRPNNEKRTTYESGEDPVGTAHIQYNIRFYVIALIFLLFEVEVAFMFPWAVVFGDAELMQETNKAWGWLTFFEMLVFVVVLLVGLAYAWSHGHLKWIKPRLKQPEFTGVVPDDYYKKINERYK